ncbi:general stress protein [Candidatus Parcubacteria bacterium]|nr:general stress protein [Candidatus Parcubacteria bacterium]
MNNDENKNSKRGLASADEETRKRVASEGGKASHSGGRPSEEGSTAEEGRTGTESSEDEEMM